MRFRTSRRDLLTRGMLRNTYSLRARSLRKTALHRACTFSRLFCCSFLLVAVAHDQYKAGSTCSRVRVLCKHDAFFALFLLPFLAFLYADSLSKRRILESNTLCTSRNSRPTDLFCLSAAFYRTYTVCCSLSEFYYKRRVEVYREWAVVAIGGS